MVISVNLAEQSYDIILERGAISRAKKQLLRQNLTYFSIKNKLKISTLPK